MEVMEREQITCVTRSMVGRGRDRRASKDEGRQHQTVLSMAATMCWVKLRAKGIAR